ncbi:MAG: hypothetical protein AAGG68_18700 [Bacteroidota bacterium]
MKILIAKVLILGLLSVFLASCEKDEFSEYYDVLYEIKYSGDVQLEYIRYRDQEGEKEITSFEEEEYSIAFKVPNGFNATLEVVGENRSGKININMKAYGRSKKGQHQVFNKKESKGLGKIQINWSELLKF